MYSYILHDICTNYEVVREYRNLFKGLCDAIHETRDNVQKIVDHVAANFTREIPGIRSFSIPLNLKKEDYKGVKYWPQSAWQAIRNRAKAKEVDTPVLGLFFEDEFSMSVSDDTKEEVQGDLTAYWVNMLREGELPVHYSSLSLKRREVFRKTMEDKYPWLRLCEGHWKVRQIWVNHYRKSRIHTIINSDPELQKKFPASKNKTPEPIEVSSDTEHPPPTQKKKHAVVIISSDPEDQSPPPENTTNKACIGSLDSSTGLKCGRQDTDTGDRPLITDPVLVEYIVVPCPMYQHFPGQEQVEFFQNVPNNVTSSLQLSIL